MNSSGFPSPFDVSHSTSGRRTNENTRRKTQSPQSTSVTEQSSYINHTALDRQEDPERIIDWIDNLEKRVKHILGRQGNEVAVLSKQKHLEEQRNKYKHILFDSQFEELRNQLEDDDTKEKEADLYDKQLSQNHVTYLEDPESGSGISDEDESKNEAVSDSEDDQEVQEVISISSLGSDDENQEEIYPEASEMEEESEQEVESESEPQNEPYAERDVESLESEAEAAVSEADSDIKSFDENIEVESQSEEEDHQRTVQDEHRAFDVGESSDGTSSSSESENLSDSHVTNSNTLPKAHLENTESSTDHEEVHDEVHNDTKNMLDENGSQSHSEDIVSIESNNSDHRDSNSPDSRVEESDNSRASAYDRTVEEDAPDNDDSSDDFEIYENDRTQEEYHDASLQNDNVRKEEKNQEDTENFDDTYMMHFEDAPENYEPHNTFNFNDYDHLKENDSKVSSHEHEVNEEFQLMQDIALKAFNDPNNGVTIEDNDHITINPDLSDIATQIKHVVENEAYNNTSHTSDITSTKLEYASKDTPVVSSDAKESSSEPSDVFATLILTDIPTSAQSGDPNIKGIDDSKDGSRYETFYTEDALHDSKFVKQHNDLEHHKEEQTEETPSPDNVEVPQSDVENNSENELQPENDSKEKNEMLVDNEVGSEHVPEPFTEHNESDIELNKSFSSETVNGSTPPPPIFKSLDDEGDPLTVLNDLKAIERKFGLQLESVKALEEEIFLQKNSTTGTLKKACDYIKGMLGKFNKKRPNYKSEIVRPSLNEVHLSDILGSEYSDSDLEAKAENVQPHTEVLSNKDKVQEDGTETLIKLENDATDSSPGALESQLSDDKVHDNVESTKKEINQASKDEESDSTEHDPQEKDNKDKRHDFNNKNSTKFRETESTRGIFVIEPEEDAEPVCTEYNWSIETGFVQDNVVSPTSVEEPVAAKVAETMKSEGYDSTEELKDGPVSSGEQVFPDLVIEPEEDEFKINALPFENENENENDAFDVLVPSFIEEPENLESTTHPESNGEKDESKSSPGGLKRKYSEVQSQFTPLKKIRKVINSLGSLIFYKNGNNLMYTIPKPTLTPIEEDFSIKNKRNKRLNSILKPSILNKKSSKDALKNNIHYHVKDDLEDNTKGENIGDRDDTKETMEDDFQDRYDKGSEVTPNESENINASGNRTSNFIDENHEPSIAKSNDDIEPKVGNDDISSSSTSVQQTDSSNKTYQKKTNSRKVFGLDISEVDLLPSHSLRNGRKFGNENGEDISADKGTDNASSASRPDFSGSEEKTEELPKLTGQKSDLTSTVLDYPAQRTRSKSPLKRSLQEILSSSKSAVPSNPHSRPSSRKRRKGNDKSQDLDETNVSESNTRGRRSHRN